MRPEPLLTGDAPVGIKDGRVVSAIESRGVGDDPLVTTAAVGDQSRYSCSGVLIAPTLVLTARHCLPAHRVAFGDVLDATATVVGVAEARAHPRLDAALLVLQIPVLAPVQHRRRGGEDHDPAGRVRAVGFGRVDADGRGPAGRKHYVDFLVSAWGCDGDRIRSAHCSPRHDLVLPSTAGKDTCRGDSGGPVFEEHDGRWRLIALTARAFGGARRVCGDGGVYTRVDALGDWIDQQMKEK